MCHRADVGMWRALRRRREWAFFGVLVKASRGLAAAWWVLLVLRGAMPALLAIATGVLVAAVRGGERLTAPLTFVGIVFVLFQVLTPLQQAVGAVLGARTAQWLHDRLMVGAVAPSGMGHLESPELADDLSMARDFDLGMTGPPLVLGMGFIASGLVQLVAGVLSALVLVAFAWWAPLVLLLAWGSTHWLLRESGVWRDRNTPEVRAAQRQAGYAYTLATDPPAAKELRLFGLGDWVVDRFTESRTRLFDLQYQATRLRERPLAGALLLVLSGNALVFWALADAVADGRLGLGAATTYLQTAVGVSAVAFGGLSWALDGAAAPAVAVLRLPSAMAEAGALAPRPPAATRRTSTGVLDVAAMPAREVRFRDVTFGYDTSSRPVLDHFDLTIPAGSSMAIVGVNGAGKTTLAKLLCRLYDPQEGALEVDGVDVRDLDVDAYRCRVTAVFQDFVRYELALRDNVAPLGAPDTAVRAALAAAGATAVTDLDTVLARGYDHGSELSGGQWQRVALARALAAVQQGAGLVLLDEPTAQLDVRGEAEIFQRILEATRHVTTVLISHRFSTVRQVDRICVLEHGQVVELGSHEELMARGGRYRTMFELQASRFAEVDEQGQEVAYDSLD
jgi:ABC-type multidrug transport system fused ATPase/permease subunit